MTDYDIFAPFYDDVMGNRRDTIRLLEREIARRHPAARSVLELGCGTGSIIAGLRRRYEVAGIERSPGMLKVARAKLPDAELHLGTIAGFQLTRRFDVIICVFDTINHLTRFSQWQKLFESSSEHLNPGGLFIFDMNTLGRLALLTRVPEYRQTFHRRNRFGLGARYVNDHTIEWQVTLQLPQPDGAIQVLEEQVREASFKLSEVRAALAGAGFTILDAFDSDRARPTDESDRVYFICRRD